MSVETGMTSTVDVVMVSFVDYFKIKVIATVL